MSGAVLGVVAELGMFGRKVRGLSLGDSGNGGESQGANSEMEPLRGNAKRQLTVTLSGEALVGPP